MFTDIRYAARTLRHAPGFAGAAIGTLALGIAANTLVFTLFHALLWRPLPVRDADAVVRLFPTNAWGVRENLVSKSRFDLLRRLQGHGLTGLAAYVPFEATAAEGDGVRSVLAYAVSASYFPLLGIELTRGAPFGEEADVDAGRAGVVVISHALWTRSFAAAETAIGRQIRLNGVAFTIVGVGPRTFMGTEPLEPEFWVPLGAQQLLDDGDLAEPDRASLLLVGRLAADASPQAVAGALSAVVARENGQPAVGRVAPAVEVVPATFFPAGPELRPVILLVMGTVALVLLIACANVANLLLTRAAGRRRELAVRGALGASTGRLAWHLTSESLLLSLAAGAAGLLLSAWTLRILYPIGVGLLPYGWVRVALDLSPDLRVFGYTMALSLLAAAFFGVWPLVHSQGSSISDGLRDRHGLHGASVAGSRVRSAFVIVQMALCLMLLAAAAVAARALERTRSLDVGIDPDGVVHTRADLGRHGYTAPAAAEFHRRLRDRAAGMPGVTDVAVTTHVPLTGGVRRLRATPDGTARPLSVTYTAASPEYFRVLGMPITAGRPFSPAEADAGAPVAVVSEALARRLWLEQEPLGRRLSIEGAVLPLTVIGVVRDASDAAIWLEKEISVYVPATPSTSPDLRLLAKTSGDPAALAQALRREAHAIDPHLQFAAAPMADVLAMWLLPSKVAAAIASLLAALALALAAVGIYAVMSYSVAQRRRELGVRIALGAASRDVYTLVLGDAGRLVAAGLVFGAAGAVILMRAVAALLPGADRQDWPAVAAAALVLASAAFVACYLPARVATTTDPLMALKSD